MTNHTDRNFLTTTSPMIQAVFTYWDRLRGDRPMPERAEFDPSAIPRHLSGVLLVEVEGVDPNGVGIYRYRVVGTMEVENRGHNPTGKLVSEGYFGASLEESIATYEWVRRNKTCMYAPLDFVTDDHLPVSELSILLPFGSASGDVSHILVYSEPNDAGFK